MPRRRGRSLPSGRGPHAQLAGARVLALLWAMGCASHRTAPDASVVTVDAHPSGDDAPVAVAPSLDARIGLGGGSVCALAEQCLSGACTLGRCSDWAHAMQIAVDTTPRGANTQEPVTAFPLLVRLNTTNFAFGEARADGADIRFLDSSGSTLAHEIERWDARQAVAEIWVLVPRISGNTLGNTVLMFWGNQLAVQTSSGPSVFGSYSCVFHMGENPNAIGLQMDDGSGQGNHGTVHPTPTVNPRGEGISGGGLVLDGRSFLTTLRRLTAPQPMTLALWLKSSSADGGGLAGFASKLLGNDGVHDRAIRMEASGRLSFTILHGGEPRLVTGLSSYNDGRWHFITARFSDAGQTLFVDGEAVASNTTLTSADAYQGFWRFGEEPVAPIPEGISDTDPRSGYYLSGLIDEARVSTSALSDDWIRLTYATQRTDATAVIYAAKP